MQRVQISPRPRDAATLILLRDPFGTQPRVLMGRRRTRDAWSNLYVFPGGRVDPTDHRAPTASELRVEVADRLQQAATPARSRALGIAAIRETFEETGVRIAQQHGAAPTPLPTRWQPFSSHGCGDWTPALDQLHFLCRAITPPKRPKRFNARFFVVDVNQLPETLQEPTSNGELGDLRWLTLGDAEQLPLPKITEAVLRVLGRRLATGSLTTPRRTPLFHSRGSRHLLSEE